MKSLKNPNLLRRSVDWGRNESNMSKVIWGSTWWIDHTRVTRFQLMTALMPRRTMGVKITGRRSHGTLKTTSVGRGKPSDPGGQDVRVYVSFRECRCYVMLCSY